MERAEGSRSALEKLKQTIEQDRADIRDLRKVCRHIVGSQETGSHGHAFDPHPPQLNKGKERGPRSLRPEDHQVDGYIGSNVDVSGGSLRSPSESP
ncbi:unnamed protein product [Penicillium camemberti]|uniref:Str. FM013 n=1 Tax=Penicillium camemberti (strain FM 013) TaxID=1429867 RepID=A0A0G4PJK3_PENC3|nr:unnamed protein product [Penicillium camemberti]